VIHVELIVNHLETTDKVSWSNADEAEWNQPLPGEQSDKPQRKVKSCVSLTEKQWWKVDWIPEWIWKLLSVNIGFESIFILLFHWPRFNIELLIDQTRKFFEKQVLQSWNHDVFRSCLRTNKNLSWGEFDKWKNEAISHLFLSHLSN